MSATTSRNDRWKLAGFDVPEQPKAKLMARLRSRRQREGWVRIEVWVPAAQVEKVRAYVRKLTTPDKSDASGE